MVRHIRFRFPVYRHGAELCTLDPAGAPTIQMEENGEILTALKGTFYDNPELEPLTDEITPELIIDGNTYQLGVFLPATLTEQWIDDEKTIDIEAYDKCWLLKSTTTEGILHLAGGTNYITAIKQLLQGAGISLIFEEPSTAALAEDREDWSDGTSYLQIINDLLAEIGYDRIFFNAEGYAVLRKTRAISPDNIVHRLNSDNVESLIIPEMGRERDMFEVPNVFRVLCSNADKSAPLCAVAENTNPRSPLSIPRRGRRIVGMYKVDNIPNQAELEAYAKQLRDDSMGISEVYKVTTGLRPGHSVGDGVELHYNDIHALCRETGWTMDLEVGSRMEHTLERVVYQWEI